MCLAAIDLKRLVRIPLMLAMFWLSSGCQMNLPLPALESDNPLSKASPVAIKDAIVRQVESVQTKSAAPTPAYMLLMDGKLEDAEKLLRADLQKKPKDTHARTNLGILLARTNRVEEAEAELNEVIEQKPSACPARMQMAQIQLDKFQVDEAQEAYLACLKAKPNYAPALLNLGILYELYRGNFDQAVHHYELYQQASIEPNTRVAGWITDLNRRIAAAPPTNQIAEVRP